MAINRIYISTIIRSTNRNKVFMVKSNNIYFNSNNILYLWIYNKPSIYK